jgi:hypothetical protein
MSLGASHLGDVADVVGGSSFDTSSVSPTANALVLVTVWSYPQSGSDPPSSVSGAGLTFTQIDSTRANTLVMSVWRALGASPSSGAITVAFAGSQYVCLVSVDEFTGVVTTGTNGADAVVQTAGNATGATVNLSAFASANNAAFGAVGYYTDGYSDAGSGFTPLGGIQDASPSYGIRTEWKVNDTSVDVADNGSMWAAIAAEIAEGGGPSASVALTGTITASVTESDIVAGGKTIILETGGGEQWIPNA